MTPSQSTDDLVKRLHDDCYCDELKVSPAQTCKPCQAAETIERLQADLEARDKTIETLREYSADLFQDDILLASVSGPDRETVIGYITHFALMFLKDGPVLIRHNAIRDKRRGK